MHRLRGQEKPPKVYGPKPAVSSNSFFNQPYLAEGYFQSKNFNNASGLEFNLNSAFIPQTEANSICLDAKSSSSINALLAKEMPIERHTTRSAPGVIARLMGLDTLPSPGPLKPQKEVSRDDSLFKKSKDTNREFKDVFEVMEAPKIEKHKNHTAHKGLLRQKMGEIDLAFVRQSFVNAKHLSSDEKLQRTKEFDDALEVLDSNKDFFLKLLQEPQSLFSKHLQDLPYSPLSPHASHVSVLKPSTTIQSASRESSLRPKENVERCTNVQKRNSQLLSKHAGKFPSLSSREPMCSSEKLSSSFCGEPHAHPSQIVILKAGPEEAGNAQRAFLSTYFMNNSKHGVLNHKELLKAKCMELNDEDRGQKKSCDTLEPMRHATRHRTKGTTEIAKEVTRKSTQCNGRKVSASNYSYYDKKEDLEIDLAKSNSQSSYWITGNINEYGSHFSQLSSCPVESAVRKEARRRESEQWRVTHPCEEIGFSSRASNTLGDMLSLSDKETLKRTLNTSSVRKACPLGISSKDGWKDGFHKNLPKSKHLPASSIMYGNFQHNHGNQFGSSKSRFNPNKHDMNNAICVHKVLVSKESSSHDVPGELSYGGENRLPVRDIHVNAEKLENRTFVGPLAEGSLIDRKLSDNFNTNMVDSIYLPQFISGESSSAAKDLGFEKLKETANSEVNRKQFGCNHREILPKEAFADYSDNELPSRCPKSFTVPPDNYYKESNQPSPVSLLELSPKKANSSLRCFKKINADLQDLQMHLHLLKLESAKSVLEEIEAFISNDKDAIEDPIPHLGDIQQALRDEDDRDYAYILDMLIDSGVLKADETKLFGACHLFEHSVSLDVFEKLEKKYRSLGLWSKSERKLLFDLVNCAFEETSAVSRPWVKPRIAFQARIARDGLVEELWRAVGKYRKGVFDSSEEILVGSNWLNNQNDAEVICKEVENMLHADLMNELVDELFSTSRLIT